MASLVFAVAIFASTLLPRVTAVSRLGGRELDHHQLLPLKQDLTTTMATRTLTTEDEGIVYHFNRNCPPCSSDAEFCGLDGQCHAYSCEAWYTLGPPFFTRYNQEEGVVSEDLTCHTVASFSEQHQDGSDRTYLDRAPLCGDDWPVAFQFLAEGNNLSRQCPVDDVPSVPYSRKCTARPTPDTVFVCYDMGGATASLGGIGSVVPTSTTRQSIDSLGSYMEEIDGLVGRHSYKLYVGGPNHGYYLPLGENNSTDWNQVAAQSSMHSSLTNTTQTEEERAFGYCEPGGCRIGEFCGRDKACHSIDCDHLYQYGPVSMAGEPQNEEDDSDINSDHAQLDCILYDDFMASSNNDTSSINKPPCDNDEDGDNDWPIALEYTCSPLYVWSGATAICPRNSKADGRLLSFARRCIGQPNLDQTFVCYDMKGVSSLSNYTSDYMNRVTNDPNCTENNLLFLHDESKKDWPTCPTDTPDCLTARHQMTNQVKNSSYGTNLYWYGMNEDAFVNDDLNLNALDHALYSQLIGARPVEEESPTSSPTSSSHSPRSQGPWKVTLSIMMMAVAALLALLV